MKATLYTQYFSDKISRRYGRRIALNKARDFTSEKLERILRSLSLSFEKKEGRYPRVPWLEGEMFLIDSNVKKSTLIKLIERRL